VKIRITYGEFLLFFRREFRISFNVMSKEQLLEFIEHMRVDLSAEKETNGKLTDQLTNVSLNNEEVDRQLQEANCLLESGRCSAAEKAATYKTELRVNEDRIIDLNEEINFNKERSEKVIKDLNMQLKVSKNKEANLIENLSILQHKLEKKEELINTFDQEVSNLQNMEDELIQVLDTKRSIFKKNGRKRKSRALEILNGTRGVYEKIRSLFH